MVDVNTNRLTAQTEVYPEVASIDTPPVGHVAVANKAGVMTSKTHDGTETALGGGGAPATATYIVQTADATLTNEQALGALATGIVKNTTTTGVLSIAVANTDYVVPDVVANTFTMEDGSTLTIVETAGVGEITVTKLWHLVDTEASAATDDLHTINGVAEGEWCILMPAHTARTVVLKKSGGNISPANGDDIELDSTGKAALVIGKASGVYAYVLHGTSLPIRSSLNLLRGSIDPTKLLTINIDGFTAGAGRTVTIPDASFTMVGEDVTQTLTNKTIDADNNTLLNYEYVGDGIIFTDPTAQTWTNLNHGGGTYTEDTTNRRMVILEDGDGTADIRGWYATAPAAPYAIRMHCKYWGIGTSNMLAVGFRQNSTSELHLLLYGVSTGLQFLVQKWNSATSFNANYIAGTTTVLQPEWFKIADDNTNRIISISNDGIVWTPIHTVGRTDFLTADEIVFGGIFTTNASYDSHVSLLSYEAL